MFARFGKTLVILALVISTGAHWAALQTVAWAAMLAGNLCTYSPAAAVTRTFDGKHPCPLCKAIAAGKKSETKKEFVLQSQKLEFPPANRIPALIAPAHYRLFPPVNFFADSLTQKPLLPPPRGFFA